MLSCSHALMLSCSHALMPSSSHALLLSCSCSKKLLKKLHEKLLRRTSSSPHAEGTVYYLKGGKVSPLAHRADLLKTGFRVSVGVLRGCLGVFRVSLGRLWGAVVFFSGGLWLHKKWPGNISRREQPGSWFSSLVGGCPIRGGQKRRKSRG